MSRTRTKVNSSIGSRATVVTSTYYPGNDTNQPNKSVDGPSYDQIHPDGADDVVTMTDVVTKDYKRRSALGEIINNPMVRHRLVVTPPNVTSMVHQQLLKKTNGCIFGSVYSGQSSLPDSKLNGFLNGFESAEYLSTKASLISQAVTHAHANASSSELAILVTAAEAGKTVDSVTSILTRVLRIIRATKKADIRYLKKQISFKELEARYMEFRYALRPLFYEVKGANQAFKASLGELSRRQTFRGMGSGGGAISDTVTSNDGTITTVVNRDVQWSIRVRAGLLCEVQASNMSIFGLTDIPQAAWELVPLSFVYDWFWNIGETIASWTPSAGVKKRASWVVVESTSYAQNTLVSQTYNSAVPFNYGNQIVWGGLSKSQLDTYVERIVDPNLSILPSFSVKLNTLKLLDLVAIFRKRDFSLRL